MDQQKFLVKQPIPFTKQFGQIKIKPACAGSALSRCNRCSCIGPRPSGAPAVVFGQVVHFWRILLAFENCRKAYKPHCLSNISPFLSTTDNQFGFKAGHSTDQCSFLLKQTASYFVTHGSSVHAVFLDASKAFDRVLHMKLFEKLIQRKVPMCFVRLLKHWYKEQTMQIKWGKHFSELFHVSNGVGQGGILSPYLFAVYLDDLSNERNNIKAGCYIGEVLLNHLMFADDICVLCPSVR